MEKVKTISNIYPPANSLNIKEINVQISPKERTCITCRRKIQSYQKSYKFHQMAPFMITYFTHVKCGKSILKELENILVGQRSLITYSLRKIKNLLK